MEDKQNLNPNQDSTTDAELEQCRHQIDDLDSQIVTLLNKRALVQQRVAEIKARTNGMISIYVPAREEIVMQNVLQANRAAGRALSDEGILAIYKQILAISRRQQADYHELLNARKTHRDGW